MDQALDRFLERLSRRCGPLEGPPRPVAGGTSGRHLLVRLGGEDYVVRRAAPGAAVHGIDFEAERAAAEYAAEIGVGPDVIAADADLQVLVTRYAPGRPLDADELREPDVLSDVAATLATLHARGRRLRRRFDAFAVVEGYREAAVAAGAPLPARHGEAAALAARVAGAMTGEGHEPVPCHNDLVPENLIHDGRHVLVLDWEFAGMGDRYFDLATLSVNGGFDEGDDEWLLTAYGGEPPTTRQLAALRLMRLVSDYRAAMWAVVEATVAERAFDLRAHADARLDRLLAAAEEGGVESWLADAGA